MRNNFRNTPAKDKCADCGSMNIKKRKNFSHGSSSRSKTSKICKDCNSTNTTTESNRRPFRK